MIRRLSLAAAALLLLVAPASAHAYWPYLGGYGGGPWSYGYFGGYPFSSGAGYNSPPPYFSIYPPVYYSHQITARPYGASPYAWPPGFSPITVRPQQEAAAPPAPLEIINPYVKQAN
ncbi:MAG: hypothetical protein SFU86_18110 [Pirellulaceae bacterium]|nr:hypothetical protein [Pirellulaceae bacterium]